MLLKSFSISRKLNISLYDSIFLALTIDLDASLITADKKLYEANKNSNYRLILLSDFVRREQLLKLPGLSNRFCEELLINLQVDIIYIIGTKDNINFYQ